MEPIIGEIRMFAGNYAPAGWAICDGSSLPINDNDTLFMLLGTTYGGDGYETFGLPDMRGRSAVHLGAGSGLAAVNLGELGGAESAKIAIEHLPAHSHTLRALTKAATETNPTGNMLAKGTTTVTAYNTNEIKTPATTLPVPVAMHLNSITSTGVSDQTPVSIMQPFIVINYIIATSGIYPSQS